jgi:hypothetical protein
LFSTTVIVFWGCDGSLWRNLTTRKSLAVPGTAICPHRDLDAACTGTHRRVRRAARRQLEPSGQPTSHWAILPPRHGELTNQEAPDDARWGIHWPPPRSRATTAPWCTLCNLVFRSPSKPCKLFACPETAPDLWPAQVLSPDSLIGSTHLTAPSGMAPPWLAAALVPFRPSTRNLPFQLFLLSRRSLDHVNTVPSSALMKSRAMSVP